MTLFVFLTRTTWARIIAADALIRASNGLWLSCRRGDLLRAGVGVAVAAEEGEEHLAAHVERGQQRAVIGAVGGDVGLEQQRAGQALANVGVEVRVAQLAYSREEYDEYVKHAKKLMLNAPQGKTVSGVILDLMRAAAEPS